MLSIKPGLTPAEAKTLLQTTAAPVPAGNPPNKVGSGVVDALRAVS